jgi:hypothetical protein
VQKMKKNTEKSLAEAKVMSTFMGCKNYAGD